MKRLLWIGDACCHTGFATVSRNVLGNLCETWDVHVLGINHHGDPHNLPYPVYPAMRDGDPYGVNRFYEILAVVRPDIIVVNHDTWNVARFLTADVSIPIVGYMPIDGPHIRRDICTLLNRLSCAIWYTEYGRDEAIRCGYLGRHEIIPHGIDLGRYKPFDKEWAREVLGFPIPTDATLIGNVNANRFRKRLDITMDVFARIRAQWPKEKDEPFFYVHSQPNNGYDGWDLNELIAFYGLSGRVLIPQGVNSFEGFPEEKMPWIYSSLDVQISTTMGEGWGLTTMEGIACGTMQVVPDFAALPEWLSTVDPMRTRHRLCPVDNCLNYPGMYNHVGKEVDRQAMADGICKMLLLENVGNSKVDFTGFGWAAVSEMFDEVLTDVLEPISTRKADPLQAV